MECVGANAPTHSIFSAYSSAKAFEPEQLQQKYIALLFEDILEGGLNGRKTKMVSKL